MPNPTRDEYKDRIVLHKQSVRTGMQRISDEIELRGISHDDDKLWKDEFELFYDASSKFIGARFGSKEYDEALSSIEPALRLHYKRNRHHPNHFENGINGMSLLDLIEMLVDWKSACKAYGDTTFEESMLINKKRFSIDEQTYEILLNTAKDLGYLEK